MSPVDQLNVKDAGQNTISVAKLVRIGEAANIAKVSERTIRYYEEIGLIKPDGHTTGGCRQYSCENIERVVRIRELQELTALNLEDIKSILDNEKSIISLKEAWKVTDNPAEQKTILQEAQESLERLHRLLVAKIARLSEFDQGITQKQELVKQLLDDL